MKAIKHKTNIQLVTELMSNSAQGVLMQAFIIEAIANYAERVKDAASNPAWASGSFISAESWGKCATEALDAITNRNKE